MLIIGHRGAAGLAPENTLHALHVGADAGADILEFDVRLTKDNVPILAHDPIVSSQLISRHTLAELTEKSPVTTLREVLDDFFGKVLLNIEIKQTSSVKAVYELLTLYITRPEDWDNVMFSSFRPGALTELRQRSNRINLALLHHINPFTFMRLHKRLELSAVGFHRLHVNPIALAVAKELGLFTYVYTVDRPETALRFNHKGIDGIVTNYPDRISQRLLAET